MKIVIDRAKWNTGGRMFEDGHLYFPAREREVYADDDGEEEVMEHGNPECLCCLGFLGRVCGKTDDAMSGISFPSDTDSRGWPTALFDVSPHIGLESSANRMAWEVVLAELNDFTAIDHATRESWIATGFQIVLGAEVEFVGSYGE